jgi:uncharacterized protein
VTRVLGAALLLGWLAAAPAVAELAVPPLAARVNDLAGLLTPAERVALEARLAAFETETSHQLAVLTLPSLEGEDLAAYSLRVVETWRLGQIGLDNGLLILVAAQDRVARIEVGYGLEGVVPDALAARIVRETMIPRFREGRMGEGISAGADALMRAARGEVIPPERRPVFVPHAPSGDPVAAVFFCAMVGGFVGALVGGRRRRAFGAGVGATLAGVGAWLMIASLFWTALAAAFGGALGAGELGRSLPGGRRGGAWGGGFGGGGGGGGGGGFSGGGGGFGGGGASGRW